MLKKIKNGANMKVIGNKISGLCQAKSGGILIEVIERSAAANVVRSEVSRMVGKEHTHLPIEPS